MPSLVDHGDAQSIVSSSSKESDQLPQKLQFNNSGDSTDVSTNPSVATADNGNPAKQNKAGSKQKKTTKKSMFSRMKSPFRGTKAKTNVTSRKEAPHTLHSADDCGNVECYVLDARAARIEEQENAKSLRPVGLASDDCGNVECCALEKGATRVERMKVPVEKLVKVPSVEEQQQQCNVAQFERQLCMQPSSDIAMMPDCNAGDVDCSFYDQVYAQLMGSPSNLDEPLACKEDLNLPTSKDVVDGSKKVVQDGMKLFDNTFDCVVNGLFPTREDFTSIQGLAIVHSESEVEMEHSEMRAEI